MSVSRATQSQPISGIVQQPFIETTPGEELPALKGQAKDLEEQLRAINARINELEWAGKDITRIAFIDSDKCIARSYRLEPGQHEFHSFYPKPVFFQLQ